MSEDATIIVIMLFWATVAYAVYLRLFVVRPLRKKIEKIAAGRANPVPVPIASSRLEEDAEFRKIQHRLQVLERLAVEKENTLSREIEELRAAGG